MVLVTPDDGPSGLSDAICSLEKQLKDMRVDLDAIYDRIRNGEFGEITNAARATDEVRRWLKLAIEAEVNLEKHRKSKKGIAYDYAIDFAEARASVSCRLDRLRRACDGKGVPGQPD